MKKLLLLLAACMVSATASAQMRVTTKQECNRRCVTLAEEFPQWAKHQEKLKQIRDRKQAEKDPAKLKQLADDEENEIDRFKDEREQTCRYICATNPEE